MRSSLVLVLFVTILYLTSELALGFTSPSIRSRRHAFLCMSSDEPTTSSDDSAPAAATEVKCPDCDLCDGSGRIAGGLGAVVPWIPIKAYRPCPNFIERGGNYQRTGQGLDEIAFGREDSSSSRGNEW